MKKILIFIFVLITALVAFSETSAISQLDNNIQNLTYKGKFPAR
jgi:hypothetical protein